MKFSLEPDPIPEDPSLPKTAEAYLAIVKGLTALTVLELNAFQDAQRAGKKEAWVHKLPGLISLVNTIGYLRGQDGFFLDHRPAGLGEYSSTLYALEDKVENILSFNLEELCKDASTISVIRQRLLQYFVQARIPQRILQEHAKQATERYTVNLKEILIQPAIEEDKVFESSSMLDILSMVNEYLKTTYPGRYPNRYTVARLTKNATRHPDGMSFDEVRAPENRRPVIPIELYPKDTQARFHKAEALGAQHFEMSDKCYLEQDDLFLAREQEMDTVLSEPDKELREEKLTQIYEKYEQKVRALWERCDAEINAIYTKDGH